MVDPYRLLLGVLGLRAISQLWLAWRDRRETRRTDPDQQRRETLRQLAAADYARRTRPAGKDGR